MFLDHSYTYRARRRPGPQNLMVVAFAYVTLPSALQWAAQYAERFGLAYGVGEQHLDVYGHGTVPIRLALATDEQSLTRQQCAKRLYRTPPRGRR